MHFSSLELASCLLAWIFFLLFFPPLCSRVKQRIKIFHVHTYICPLLLLCFSHTAFYRGWADLSVKKANRESRPITPHPLKEQRACGINQNAKHNNKVPWEREPCDCVPACTPLGDGGRGAHLTAAGGSFLSALHLPSRCHQSIHYPENWLTFVGRRESGEERRAGGRGRDRVMLSPRCGTARHRMAIL